MPTHTLRAELFWAGGNRSTKPTKPLWVSRKQKKNCRRHSRRKRARESREIKEENEMRSFIDGSVRLHSSISGEGISSPTSYPDRRPTKKRRRIGVFRFNDKSSWTRRETNLWLDLPLFDLSEWKSHEARSSYRPNDGVGNEVRWHSADWGIFVLLALSTVEIIYCRNFPLACLAQIFNFHCEIFSEIAKQSVEAIDAVERASKFRHCGEKYFSHFRPRTEVLWLVWRWLVTLMSMPMTMV